jgi:hypothetical protein
METSGAAGKGVINGGGSRCDASRAPLAVVNRYYCHGTNKYLKTNCVANGDDTGRGCRGLRPTRLGPSVGFFNYLVDMLFR